MDGCTAGEISTRRNANRGAIGQAFIRSYLSQNEIEVGGGSRVTPTDLSIAGRLFEAKTAS